MLTAMALLVLVMLLIHPRFLVRLMASLHRRKQVTEKRPYAYNSPPDSTTSLQQTTTIKKQVGGGDLRSGWVLLAGKELPPAIDNNSIKSDPFASSYDLNVGVCSSPPTQLPPPHVVPLLQHIPFSSTLLWAPFAKLPRWIASSVKLGELYLILGYLIANAFAMIWRSDITPTTADKGYGYNFQRTGLVAMIQIPLVVALGVRGNIVGLCVGKGYEKLKRLHKIVGRVLFLAATLHTAFYREFSAGTK
jgi:ferric-chelate reductase